MILASLPGRSFNNDSLLAIYFVRADASDGTTGSSLVKEAASGLGPAKYMIIIKTGTDMARILFWFIIDD
jgi:hypothetical protein